MTKIIEKAGVSDNVEMIVWDKFGNVKHRSRSGRKVSQLEKLMLAEATIDLCLTEARLKGSELRWN